MCSTLAAPSFAGCVGSKGRLSVGPGRRHLGGRTAVAVGRRAAAPVRVAAVVVEALGQGSHAALLAREKGIPTVADFPGLLSRIGSGTELLVDGFRGDLAFAPREATRGVSK